MYNNNYHGIITVEKSTEKKLIMSNSKNVLGKSLEICCQSPVTGFYRNGCCDTGAEDFGLHVVCAQVTAEFLKYSKDKGNDLITPMPMYNFPGLKTRG